MCIAEGSQQEYITNRYAELFNNNSTASIWLSGATPSFIAYNIKSTSQPNKKSKHFNMPTNCRNKKSSSTIIID